MMKGILPVYFRTLGYAVLLLSVFVALSLFLFGVVNDANLLLVKGAVKLLIWCSLFVIFLARVKDEGEETSHIRTKAMKYALFLLGVYYAALLGKSLWSGGNPDEADSSIAIVYMALNVISLEFFVQKHRVEKAMKR